MPADIPKYALRPHSLERLAHPVQHIAGARRAPALLCFVIPVPRFIARTVLDESGLVFRRCLASEANIRKNSLTKPESESASSRRPTGPSKYMYTSSICMYCRMHMFTREEHAVVPCEPTTTSPLTVRHEIHMCCAPAPCQHCSRTAGTTQNAVGAVLAVQTTVKNFRLRRALLQPTNRA